jgi:diaminopropionate ammonia-lyase
VPPGWFAHPAARDWTCAPAPVEVLDFHAALPGYAATPLAELPALAVRLGVGRVFVKDESSRLGLPAFKALGASWAVHRVLAGRPSGEPVLLVTATDGNHGRAVARIAALCGQRAHVFVPLGVSTRAVAAIAAEGARVTEVDGSYDEAVRLAAAAASDDPGAVLVQDTAWPGYEEIPSWIVQGYATLFAEIDAQLGAEPPGLVVVPVGVGSLAWPYLRRGLDAATEVTDRDSEAAVRELAELGVSCGPCGAAALAGARAALTGPDSVRRRADLGLGPTATVVLLSTEGAADPARPAA